jgi:trk system potassium uptake protein TrkH
MDFRLISRLLGIVILLIGASMAFSLPWAFPQLGHRWVIDARDAAAPPTEAAFEARGFLGLVGSMVACIVVGGGLFVWGRHNKGQLFRKEALAVVGLSWILATVMGALPFYLSGTLRCSSVRLLGPDNPPLLFQFDAWRLRTQWEAVPRLSAPAYAVVAALQAAGARGVPRDQLATVSSVPAAEVVLQQLSAQEPSWREVLVVSRATANVPVVDTYRLRWVPMGLADACFESQSGFSTTGATVIADLEDSAVVPHCILFWRSTTHFLGGLGIIVLFVSLLGGGTVAKALMRAEMPGPTKEGATERMQETAWLFAAVYLLLNIVLALILHLAGLTVFDALCHAFGTMATGGFSTYNASVGHFAQYPQLYHSVVIETAIIVFMVLAGTNFTLLYLCLMRRPQRLLADIEWRAYIAIIAAASLSVVLFGWLHRDFAGLADAVRYGTFQVVSIITTTGFGTHDFDRWNSYGRAILFVLMFVGGCAGSTGGGLKVIRHVLLVKILRQEIELAGHPRVVRPLSVGGKSVIDPTLRKSVLVYFCLIMAIFVFSWVFLVAFEPGNTWGPTIEHKLIDCASGVAATLNNIGPGLGIVGATQQYTAFSPVSKIFFVWLMMLGRLELFSILVLFSPRFWRTL